MLFYVNGKLQSNSGTDTVLDETLASTAGPLIGKTGVREDDTENITLGAGAKLLTGWEGLIDEIAFFTEQLGQQKIEEWYRVGIPTGG